MLEKVAMHGIVVIIKRTHRKASVGFRMSLGQLVVLVPHKMPRSQIDRLLESKSGLATKSVNQCAPFYIFFILYLLYMYIYSHQKRQP